MHLLQPGVDVTVIALGLSHEDVQTTQGYLQADLAPPLRRDPPGSRRGFPASLRDESCYYAQPALKCRPTLRLPLRGKSRS